MNTMKRNSPNNLSPNQPSDTSESQLSSDPLNKADALWDLLDQASERKADAFFARNVVRETRQLTTTQASWTERLAGALFTKKAILPFAAVACMGVIAVNQFKSDEPVTAAQPAPVVTTESGNDDPSTDLAELIIEESLVAAAEDPSQFTHDELVAMVGL